jgi:predicted N-acetyltransferase YhbS
MNIVIRKEEEKDYKQVYEVNKLAFQQENESILTY